MRENTKPNCMGECSSSTTSSILSSSGVLRLKRVPDAEVMASIQMAVHRTVSALEVKPERDLLIQDFMNFESLTLRSQGSQNAFVEFKFHNYAPIAFKYFRRLFQIKTKNFLRSMCSEKLRQLENSGSSGSAFFLTDDDEYILKTAQQREGEFLLKLLPGYYLNLTQNPQTLLPKFFGFYCYCGQSNVRIVVMNNLIPTNIPIEQKYDLKGSTTRRKATQAEMKKPFPTYKDLDFIEHYPEGLLLEADTYTGFVQALQRDCRVLESFKIIDYSLLLAVHHVKKNVKKVPELPSGIPAWTTSGEELLLFVGIIDILQCYQFRKKLEHTLKSFVYEKDSISVHRPDFYSQRFQNFINQTVFRPMPKRRPTLPVPKQLESMSSGENTSLQSPLSLSWIFRGAKYQKLQEPLVRLNAPNNSEFIPPNDVHQIDVRENSEKPDTQTDVFNDNDENLNETYSVEKTVEPEVCAKLKEGIEQLQAVDVLSVKKLSAIVGSDNLTSHM